MRKIIRRNSLGTITCLSLSTIDRLRKKGLFPEPVLLTGAQAVGWFSDVIDEWLAARMPKQATTN